MTIERKRNYLGSKKSNTDVNSGNSYSTYDNSDIDIKDVILFGTGMSYYEYPTDDVVPPGNYYSEIKYARAMRTKTGQLAFEVLYTFLDVQTCYKIVNKLAPKSSRKFLYVKQYYQKGTPYYVTFSDAMMEALGLRIGQKFTLDQVIGVTEYVSLGYDKGIGTIKRRMPYDADDFIDPKYATQEETVDSQVVEIDTSEAQENIAANNTNENEIIHDDTCPYDQKDMADINIDGDQPSQNSNSDNTANTTISYEASNSSDAKNRARLIAEDDEFDDFLECEEYDDSEYIDEYYDDGYIR